MITVTANQFLDKIDSSHDEIILNGPPTNLKGNIRLSNKEDQAVFIKEFSVTHSEDTKSKARQALPSTFRLNAFLKPGEQKNQVAFHEMHPQTPPGVYESTINIGGRERRLRLVVQENIKIDITPSVINFLGVVPGQTYNKELLLTNSGNVPFTIPDIKHNTVLDFDYICRALSKAIREKGDQGIEATLDEVTKDIHDEMAGWVDVKIDEAGTTVDPGDIISMHLGLTLPGDANPLKDYFGNIRIWNKTITYKIKSFFPI